MSLEALALGQAGVRLAFDDTVVYIDPYLTDYVAAQHGEALRRLIAPPMTPSDVRDASWVLITHAHEDHADPTTLGPLAQASPHARFMCPPPVVDVLLSAGIEAARIELASEQWRVLSDDVDVKAVPAAHLEIDRTAEGTLRCVGYLLRSHGRLLYHAGDTIPHEDIRGSLEAEGPIDYALLPVNERNYYRDAQGIVGNMSVREALQMASEIRALTLIPVHWDLFAPNSTPRAEIELLHGLIQPGPALRFCASGTSELLW